MFPFFDAFASSELLYTGNIHTIYTCSIIGEKSSQRPPNHFTSVHHTYSMAEESIPIWQYGVVDTKVLQDLDHSQRCAREYALLCLGVIEKSDILIHVEYVSMAKTFDILGDIDDLL
jgi:hypothetical protein